MVEEDRSERYLLEQRVAPSISVNRPGLITKYLPTTSYVGEVGLDFSPDGIATQAQQVESFRFVLKQVGTRKVVNLHSRMAEKQVLAMIQEHQVPYAIFHLVKSVDSFQNHQQWQAGQQ